VTERATLPPCTWCVLSKLPVINALETWFASKLVVLRNLEAKLLKTPNLRVTVHGLD